jgi:transmembrane sensor
VTEPTKAPELDPLLDEALDWVVRLKTGAPIRADIEALQQWRDLSPAHEQAFKRAARLLRDAGIAARELADEQSAVNAAPALQRSPPQIMARRVVLGGAIAAAAAGYMVVRPPLDLWPSLEELSADYRTGKGEQRKVLVAADVSLELNTQTSVALRSAQNETQIELISGEASVAAKRRSRPLVMLAANGRITAVEANFNARCLDGIVSVACVDGVVDVMQGNDTVQLHKAEQVSYSSAGIEASVPVDPEQVGAWRAGLLIFRDKPLANVVNEVNRYRPGKIIITNADLKRRLVNGTFQLDKLENFVAQVQQLFGVRATPLLGGVVLLS